MTLVQAMRSDLPSLTASDSLASAAAVMAGSGCQTLPVFDDRTRLVGELSVEALAYWVGRNGGLAGGVVQDAMHTEPLSCPPGTGIEEVERLLRTHRRPALFVIEGDGPVLGAIDIYQALDALDPPQAVAGPEPEYVQRVRGEA